MNTTALRLPGKKAIPLHEWQAAQAVGLRQEYDASVNAMRVADRSLREANEQLKCFRTEKDSADRDMVFYCSEGKKKRVKLSAPREFREKILAPRSRAFKDSMIQVRDLHFTCRNQGIDVPLEVFRFLDSWGMIEREKRPKATKK